MAVIRFSLDLAIPKSVYDALPAATKTTARNQIRALKALAVKINAGQLNEEMTVKATYHICHHDEGNNVPCESEQEI
jgi:hypothetical protein